ncbi:phenylalanyl-tRNA synthetase [Basidiobolus meristosporus CBS 931.73]|uniref:Phenylalanine--tRNA ligase, mitochondrial n=1 Tax=Basidiobolus meristosporus CBS 931.73 TaxID=1314790 RepID=A0A1Y1YEU7_9FUNG|nr:phenylalanyl-tRNA synthetase [Basidiobolus meristosporus CBS 931.73]|eukprot:ORX96114.1 phenylalanyl-tRNA synthetase [Basidiobolus meristosporus CBS 931.73]
MAFMYQACRIPYGGLKQTTLLTLRRTTGLLGTPEVTKEQVKLEGKTYPADESTNVTPSILSKVGRNLHNIPEHPIGIIKSLIYSKYPSFDKFDTFSPVVTTKQNFDDLLIPPGHPGRALTDTYYLNNSTMLRTHTSAHQSSILSSGCDKFLVAADVYRRDEIDASHYPVFHQMEGAQIFDMNNAVEQIHADIKAQAALFGEDNVAGISTQDDTVITPENPLQACHSEEAALATIAHLKHSLNSMVRKLFSDEKDLQVRWIDAYFPFTSPSWEMEIFYKGQWLEVYGCGVIKQEILNNAGQGDKIGWAFGLGLERLAMVLFGIPDIRLFWSQDERFLSQFQSKEIVKFKPFSKHPSCTKDISFWVNEAFHENDFCELIRDIAEDLVEDVKLVDDFTHPKTKKQSLCYRINYRSMDR